MKRTDADQPDEVSEAFLEGSDVMRRIPGTRPDIAEDLADMTGVFAPMLDALPEAEPPEGLFAAIEAEIDALPAAPVSTLRAEEGTWEKRSDKVWKKVLACDPGTGRSMYLLRCLPGARIKPHVHERAEHLFILEGEFWVGNKLYSTGDAQISAAGTEHAEIRMPGGCLVLISA